MAQVVISGQNAIKANMDSIDFIIKYSNYSNYFKRIITVKIVIVAIGIAVSLLTTLMQMMRSIRRSLSAYSTIEKIT